MAGAREGVGGGGDSRSVRGGARAWSAASERGRRRAGACQSGGHSGATENEEGDSGHDFICGEERVGSVDGCVCACVRGWVCGWVGGVGRGVHVTH